MLKYQQFTKLREGILKLREQKGMKKAYDAFVAEFLKGKKVGSVAELDGDALGEFAEALRAWKVQKVNEKG